MHTLGANKSCAGSAFGMIVHACDACGVAIRSGALFAETLCGDCASQGLPPVAHTVCQSCGDRGADVIRFALRHQVVAHGMPPSVMDAQPLALDLWRVPARVAGEVSELFRPTPRTA